MHSFLPVVHNRKNNMRSNWIISVRREAAADIVVSTGLRSGCSGFQVFKKPSTKVFWLLLQRWLTTTGSESYTQCWDHPVHFDFYTLTSLSRLYSLTCVLVFLWYAICLWASSLTVTVVSTGSGQVCVCVCVCVCLHYWFPLSPTRQ